MKTWFKKLAVATALGASISSALAADVGVFGQQRSGSWDKSDIVGLYAAAGHTSSELGSLTSSSIAGLELLWLTQPSSSYTGSELTALQGYLSGGGRIAFLGEHGTFAPAENTRINEALTFLGASITIQNELVDSGFRSASVGDGQILAHPLTEGVDSYQYAAFAPLVLSGTAVPLMLGEAPGTVMMAYQNIGPGSIFLITDQNVWDNYPDWGDFDNARMFENLVGADTGAPPVTAVPEPSTYALMALGLLAVGLRHRRRAD